MKALEQIRKALFALAVRAEIDIQINIGIPDVRFQYS